MTTPNNLHELLLQMDNFFTKKPEDLIAFVDEYIKPLILDSLSESIGCWIEVDKMLKKKEDGEKKAFLKKRTHQCERCGGTGIDD